MEEDGGRRVKVMNYRDGCLLLIFVWLVKEGKGCDYREERFGYYYF